MVNRSNHPAASHAITRMSALALTLFAVLCLAGCSESDGGNAAPSNPAADAAPRAAGPSLVTSLEIEDLVVGDGVEAKSGQTVDVHYTGWLYDPSGVGNRGTKFDSSHDRGRTFSFPLGGRRVIVGWDEGVAGMKVGGKRVLTIPADKAYGARGAAGGLIPPNAALVFEVDLIQVR